MIDNNVDEMNLVDSIVELKFLVGQLSQYAIVSPNKKDIRLLSSILVVVEHMDIPELIGGDDYEN